MTTPKTERYPLLADLVNIHFGQGADLLFGETGAQVMDDLRGSWSDAEQQALRAQIAEFAHAHLEPDELEQAFERDFHRAWRPDDFGATAQEFLGYVLRALE